MSDRYVELYRIPSKLYAEGSPVLVEAGALYKDSLNGKVLAQVKLRNLSEKHIVACKINIHAYEPNGQKTEGVEGFAYLDLNAGTGQEFGMKVPIYLPSVTARRINIAVTEVVFDTQEVWKAIEKEWIEVKNFVPLAEKISDEELLKQYRIEVGTSATYWPRVSKGLFQCTCGTLNLESAETCYICNRKHSNVIAALNMDALTEKKDLRLKQEQEAREAKAKADEEARIAREEAERRRQAELEERRIVAEKAAKKRKKIIAIIAAIVCICVVATVVVVTVIIPNGKYNDAVDLMKAGKYEEAIAAFEAMEGYKDSVEKITECQTAIKDLEYDAALELVKACKYEEAIAAFEAMEVYKDSKEKITECQNAINDLDYNAAVELMKVGKYEDAIAAFEAIDGYKDSEGKITECQTAIKDEKYNAAVKLMNVGKYDEAIDIFSSLSGYKDSTQKLSTIYAEKRKNAKVGDTIIIGAYEQDNDTTNGKEAIEWLVLEKKGSQILVISKYGLDCQKYNTTRTDTTWEKCSLRKWLNESFINAAFSKEEQKCIPKVTIKNPKNSKYGTSGGNNTSDKVFLLSIEEAEKYFKSDNERKCQATEYAVAKGADASGGSCWNLRSPGYDQHSSAAVEYDGSVRKGGGDVDFVDCVRPALWINLES